ncbi:hypothetical protein CFR72_06750, partial [Gluconacetobacter entanii]
MDQSRPVPGFRWRIGCLLALGVFVNYIDRIALSVASPQIQMGWTASMRHQCAMMRSEDHSEETARMKVTIIG